MDMLPAGWVILCLLVSLLTACGDGTAPGATIEESSGIARCGDALCVVDDSLSGAFFRVPLRSGAGPLIPLNSSGTVKVDLPRIGIWIDLEGIDFLADGRIALLSERLRSLVGEEGLIAEYDYPLTEFGRRGLEGVSVRPLPDGSSRIAVLWEGGYPDLGSLGRHLEERAGGIPMPPLVFVHDLKPGATVGRIGMQSAVHFFELEVPRPEGEEPSAQRFRAPDLVWYKQPGEHANSWGFIVLLSSQNAVEKLQFLHHWLQRFNMEGQPVGSPLDIAEFVPPELGRANWEGLGWFDEGRSLVLVHEGSRDFPPNAFILDLPPDWQLP